MARGKKKEKILTPEEKLLGALVPESEQPYKVPENWRWTRVGYINRYNSSCVDPSKQPETMYELYSVPSSSNDYPEILEGQKIGSTKQEVEKGDVLLCKINPRINRVWKISQHTDYKLLASSEWIIIRNKSIITDYLMHCFRSPFFRDYMLSNVSGVGGSLMRAQPKYVKEYPVPIPPLSEQQRIVDRIESLFTKLDEAKEKAQAVVDGFEDRKAAILRKAFTGELTKEWRERNNKNESGPYNKKLSELCIKITDGTHHSPPNNSTGRYMYITAKNIKESGIDLSDVSFVSQSVHEEIYSRCDVQYGDVLYIKDGATTGIATVNRLREQFSLLSSVAVLRVNSMLNNEYLAFALNSRDIKQAMLEKMAGVAITRLTLTKIKASEIPVFSIEEQYQIIKILKRIIKKEQKAKESAEQVIAQIDNMKKSILARAFRGELGTNDPSDESAEELLKRIL